jgi:hypothetical protein
VTTSCDKKQATASATDRRPAGRRCSPSWRPRRRLNEGGPSGEHPPKPARAGSTARRHRWTPRAPGGSPRSRSAQHAAGARQPVGDRLLEIARPQHLADDGQPLRARAHRSWAEPRAATAWVSAAGEVDGSDRHPMVAVREPRRRIYRASAAATVTAGQRSVAFTEQSGRGMRSDTGRGRPTGVPARELARRAGASRRASPRAAACCCTPVPAAFLTPDGSAAAGRAVGQALILSARGLTVEDILRAGWAGQASSWPRAVPLRPRSKDQ